MANWTSTPEGRARMSKIAKERWKHDRPKMMKAIKKIAAEKKAKSKSTFTPLINVKEEQQAQVVDQEIEGKIIYALGWIESWITTYSASTNVPRAVITSRLGEVFHRTGRRG